MANDNVSRAIATTAATDRSPARNNKRRKILLILAISLVASAWWSWDVNKRPLAMVASAVAVARLVRPAWCPPPWADRGVPFLPQNRTKSEQGVSSTYSGMWWMSVDAMLGVPYKKTDFLESVSFRAYRNAAEVMAPVDWLDLNVEHLSKYVKHFNGFDDGEVGRKVRDRVADMLERYIEKARATCHQATQPAVSSTIALLPFHIPPGKDGARLATLEIAATLASLWNVGFPRAVIVGVSKIEQQAFARIGELLTEHRKARGMELVYVQMSRKGLPTTTRGLINVPPAAVIRFQSVVKKYRDMNGMGDENSARQNATAQYKAVMQNSTKNVEAWLGADPTRWAYIYFSEPDLLLHLRPGIVPALANHLERGHLVAAHRLHPVPHMRQFRDIHENSTAEEAAQLERMVLPDLGTFAGVYSLDEAQGHACCDQGIFFPSNRPDPFRQYPVRKTGMCENNWAYCGFKKTGPNHSDWAGILKQHGMLLPHALVSLERGTGWPLVQASQRACTPQTGPNATCPRAAPSDYLYMRQHRKRAGRRKRNKRPTSHNH